MDYTPTELMTIAAARALGNDDVCFVGIGAPSTACNLARLTHAPDITLIYESGTIGARPRPLVRPHPFGSAPIAQARVCHFPRHVSRGRSR
jgi:glutaconate CoA-transferase, subunit B